MSFVPVVIEQSSRGERSFDIFSRLLKERIIMIHGEINDNVSSNVIAQLLYLSSNDPTKDIYIYINSVGGSITSGMAIYDTMRYIKCDVNTICVGMCASMAAFLLAAGSKGKRYALKNSKIIWLLGTVILFAGTYLSYSAKGVSFWNESVVSNTTILGCAMMFYMFFLCVALVHFLKNTKIYALLWTTSFVQQVKTAQKN